MSEIAPVIMAVSLERFITMNAQNTERVDLQWALYRFVMIMDQDCESQSKTLEEHHHCISNEVCYVFC